MITSCRNYVDDSGKRPLWKQDPTELADHLRDCIALSKAYRDAYHSTKASVREDQRPLKFSEVQIFGDFKDFVARVEAILHIVEMLQKYSILRNVYFEGVDRLLKQYEAIRAYITSRNYDYLNPENTFFIRDFERFGKEIAQLGENVQVAYNAQVGRSSTVMLNLRDLMRLEGAKLPSQGQEVRYRRLINTFKAELEEIANIYTRDARDPRMGRDMPPCAGRGT